MSVQIRAARDEDAPAVAALNTQTFGENITMQKMFPAHLRTKEGFGDQLDWGLTRTRKSLDDPFTHHILAVATEDGQEAIVGAAEWCAPRTAPDAPPKSEEEKKREADERMKMQPACMDKDAVKQSREDVNALLEKAEPAFEGRVRDKMWTLNSLAVAPAYRGRGIGKMLTRWGMESADKTGEDIWLVAAPPGRNLYLSLGFTQIAEGARFGEPQYCMLRLFEPKQ